MDKTLSILRKYESWITFWISEPDNGQSHAINKGFKKCNGDLVNWICSDDLLCRNALNHFVKNCFIGNSYFYVGKCLLINKSGIQIGSTTSQISSFEELTDITNHWRKNDSIAQQSTLYPINVVKKIGGLNENNHYTMDYELWGDLLLNGIGIKNIPLEIGIYRWYEGQKTSLVMKATYSLVCSAISLSNRNPKYSFFRKCIAITVIVKYYLSFLYHQLRSFIGIRRRFSMHMGNGL
jgi:glycosyltransferase involved in cell wall biosynthesis